MFEILENNLVAKENNSYSLSMRQPAELREAPIHFELYGLLANAISVENEYVPIRYDSVKPEVQVKTGSADIVLYARIKEVG